MPHKKTARCGQRAVAIRFNPRYWRNRKNIAFPVIGLV